MISTGRTIALIKALNKNSGNSSSEEQFTKVYETTLEETTESILLSSSDLDGVYVDMLVYLENPTPIAASAGYIISFFADDNGENILGGSEGTLPANGDWTILTFALSYGGLLESGETVDTINGIITKRFFVDTFGTEPLYPTEQRPGVVAVSIAMENGIPAGTKIFIYARKKVA